MIGQRIKEPANKMFCVAEQPRIKIKNYNFLGLEFSSSKVKKRSFAGTPRAEYTYRYALASI